MQVEVPLGNGDATQRRIERIAAPGAGLEREAMRMRVTVPVVGMPVMAVSIMGGLIVATVLTLLALPAMYAAWFRVKREETSAT